MKTMRIHEFGGPEVLSLEDVPTPEPGTGQILIEVGAAAVNYSDVKRRRADPYPFPTDLPFVPGGEVAGRVAALGEGVNGPPAGTPVFALVGGDGSTGYAQYALAAAEQVIPIPPGLEPDQAAGLIIAGSTAMLALARAARLQQGESVLIQGAAGGVGSLAVQIARHLGAGTIIAAASTPARRDAALRLGADHAIDSTGGDWPEQVRRLTGGQGVDVVLETNGGPRFAAGLNAVAPFGRIVVLGMATSEPGVLDPDSTLRLLYAPAPNHSLIGFNVGLWFGMRPQESVAALTELIGLVAAGLIEVPVGHVLPLERAADAHRLLEQREANGKIILRPWAA